jgi:hypothetical protein
MMEAGTRTTGKQLLLSAQIVLQLFFFQEEQHEQELILEITQLFFIKEKQFEFL